MSLLSWLDQATAKLTTAGIDSARLDCLILLEDALNKDRSWILAHGETELNGRILVTLNKQVTQRAKHIPLAYIRHQTEFYGRDFIITEAVLEPRPETETMISLFLGLPKKPKTIIDIGTGSGAIAITVKLEAPKTQVLATDIDRACLNVAKKNAVKHNANIELLQGNLLEPVKNLKPDAILANLPYVPDDWQINQAATNEPKIAIFGGPDGLDLYRSMFDQIKTFELLGNLDYVLTESLPPQHDNLGKIAKQHGFGLMKTQDFIQIFKKSN